MFSIIFKKKICFRHEHNRQNIVNSGVLEEIKHAIAKGKNKTFLLLSWSSNSIFEGLFILM